MAKKPSSRTTISNPGGSRPGSGQRAREDRAAKVAAARAAAARGDRRRKMAIGGATGVVIAAIAAGVAAMVLNQPSSAQTSAAAHALPTPPAVGATTLPPWPAPADPSDGIRAAGLQMSNMEGTAAHFHSHLDIFVNGREVPVTADIGINRSTGVMSELHTHDTSGVLHVESPVADKRYVLGQLFDEWDVRLDRTHLGGLVTGSGKQLTAYVDGKPVNGNPAGIELLEHRAIALVYGRAGQKVDVPSSYAFPEGL